MELTREYEAAMYRFVYNCFSMCIYALLFGAIIYIGDFGLATDKHFALSLILGFFAGLLNDIGRKIEFFNRDMLEERKAEVKVEPKFKVGDVIRLKGSAATYTIKRVTDTTYYTDGWSCGIERCEEDYELVEQNIAEKQGKGTNGNNEEIPNSWSEEDNNMFYSALWYIKKSCNKGDRNSAEFEVYNWFKHLKDRVQLYPQQEWSKEDKQKMDRIYSILGQAADTHAFSTTCRLIGDKECVELQDFLKALKERIIWKPSEEQMDALEKHLTFLRGMNAFGEGVDRFNDLYNDLMKLRGGE